MTTCFRPTLASSFGAILWMALVLPAAPSLAQEASSGRLGQRPPAKPGFAASISAHRSCPPALPNRCRKLRPLRSRRNGVWRMPQKRKGMPPRRTREPRRQSANPVTGLLRSRSTKKPCGPKASRFRVSPRFGGANASRGSTCRWSAIYRLKTGCKSPFIRRIDLTSESRMLRGRLNEDGCGMLTRA